MRKLIILGIMVAAIVAAGCEKELQFKDVSPKTGKMSGGDPVTISGTGFSGNMGIVVYVGTNRVENVAIQGSEKLAFSTPPSNTPGPADIRIVLDNGSEYLIQGQFTYVEETGGGSAGMDIRDLGTRSNRTRRRE